MTSSGSAQLATVLGRLKSGSTAPQVDEDGLFAWIEVTREGGTGGEVSIDYATSDGTAIAGLDYEAQNGTLVFGDGEFRKGFALQDTQ